MREQYLSQIYKTNSQILVFFSLISNFMASLACELIEYSCNTAYRRRQRSWLEMRSIPEASLALSSDIIYVAFIAPLKLFFL